MSNLNHLVHYLLSELEANHDELILGSHRFNGWFPKSRRAVGTEFSKGIKPPL
jgi:hypothetical protein